MVRNHPKSTRSVLPPDATGAWVAASTAQRAAPQKYKYGCCRVTTCPAANMVSFPTAHQRRSSAQTLYCCCCRCLCWHRRPVPNLTLRRTPPPLFPAQARRPLFPPLLYTADPTASPPAGPGADQPRSVLRRHGLGGCRSSAPVTAAGSAWQAARGPCGGGHLGEIQHRRMAVGRSVLVRGSDSETRAWMTMWSGRRYGEPLSGGGRATLGCSPSRAVGSMWAYRFNL